MQNVAIVGNVVLFVQELIVLMYYYKHVGAHREMHPVLHVRGMLVHVRGCFPL